MKACLIKAELDEADGIISHTVERIEVNGLNDMQKAVGGYIEAIDMGNIGHLCCGYVNEEGKLTNLPPNTMATEICSVFNVGLGYGDFIAGNMLIVGPLDDEGNHLDLPEKVISSFESYSAMF